MTSNYEKHRMSVDLFADRLGLLPSPDNRHPLRDGAGGVYQVRGRTTERGIRGRRVAIHDTDTPQLVAMWKSDMSLIERAFAVNPEALRRIKRPGFDYDGGVLLDGGPGIEEITNRLGRRTLAPGGSIDDFIAEVLTLQSDYTATATTAMVRRGQLVLHAIPDWVSNRLADLANLVPGATDDLRVDASDGAGAKARVPWSRIFSISRAPGASEGWYIALLFGATGEAAYLSLNQGSTRWDHGNFVTPLSGTELMSRANWARESVSGLLSTRADVLKTIDMEVGPNDLGARYEAGNVAAFRYPLGSVPDADTIDGDLRFMVRALGAVYVAAEGVLQLPGEPPPEVADAIAAAQRVASPRRPQAHFRLSHAERVAIERRAVDVATLYLTSEGFTDIRDVGAKKSWDLEAHLDNSVVYVEVKGTTSTGKEVVLTKNEVDRYGEKHPGTMLIVVTGITLDRSQTPPVASGGHHRRFYPWEIRTDALTPISYRYQVPHSDGPD